MSRIRPGLLPVDVGRPVCRRIPAPSGETVARPARSAYPRPRERLRAAAAFFDLDKTVIAKSSTLAFGKPFYRGGLVNRRAVLKSSFAQFVYLLQGADEDSMDRMRDYLKTLCAGWPVEQVNAIVAETLHELIDPMVYAEAVALFDEHHAAGLDVVIVSSSGEEVVGPIGDMLGVDHVVATRMVVEDGRYTGEIAFYAYGEGKAVAIRELAEERGYDLEQCWAYSDSFTDRPMLELVGNPVAVNPDKAAAPPRRRAGLAAARVPPAGARARPRCRRCRRRPDRRPRTPACRRRGRRRPRLVGEPPRRACDPDHNGSCTGPGAGVQRTHGPPPAGGRRSPRRRSVRREPGTHVRPAARGTSSSPPSPGSPAGPDDDGHCTPGHLAPAHGDGGPPSGGRRSRRVQARRY